MKAVVLVGGLQASLRPMTLTLPLPLIPFVNKPLIMHQLQALKEVSATKL
jgi:mannose-1-phosphate guanylyltransferase